MDNIFEESFQAVLKLEGGFVLHKNKFETDVTFAGIYKSANPNWDGWRYIDNKDFDNPELTKLVREFYYNNFYNHLTNIKSDKIKYLLFEFGVNAGKRKAIMLAQTIINTTPDGILGDKTIESLNATPDEIFTYKFFIARVKHYVDLSNKQYKYKNYLLGWLNRSFASLGGIA